MTNYNDIAGRSLERLSALSDGIFAIAMTLLVLDLRVPVVQALGGELAAYNPLPLWIAPNIHLTVEQTLWTMLSPLLPRLLVYFMSFLTLGIFWLGQQTQLSSFERSNRDLAWIHMIFLFAVSLMPFSTALLANYITFRLALVVYWLNLLLLGVMLYLSVRYAWRAQLVKDPANLELRNSMVRRIENYQILYAFGALLCIVSTYLSIAFIVLLELNSVLAPRIRWLNRL